MARNDLSRLGTAPLGKLLREFGAPAVVSLVVNSVYNIVDQIFIGWGVGYLGNAATNVSFPLVAITMALALLLGNGSCSNFSLSLGRRQPEEAAFFVGNSLAVESVLGSVLAVFSWAFLTPMLKLFGATPTVLPYAQSYGAICLIGTPFVMVTLGLVNLIRADGSPRWAMWSSLTGALLNVALDPIFIFDWGLGMGVAGAAAATVISQMVSFFMTVAYAFRFNSITLQRHHFRIQRQVMSRILSLGASSLLNNVTFIIVQICMNNALVSWGTQSPYGSDIPLSVMGIVMKVNQILIAVLIGISIGAQPILGFNYGAGNMGRVRRTYGLSVWTATVVCVLGWSVFQLWPDQVMELFGRGSDLYFQFARRCFRVYLFTMPIVGYQIVSGLYFQATGRPGRSIVLTLVQRILFMVPAILLLPLAWGFDGLLYTMPVADLAATAATTLMIVPELRRLRQLENSRPSE